MLRIKFPAGLTTTAMFILAAGFCSPSHGVERLVSKSARQSSRDVKIPRALVAMIEKDYRTFLSLQEVAAVDGIKRRLINLSAELIQDRSQALFEDVRIAMPIGGGVIDLAEFVSPLKGAFDLKITGSQDELPLTDTRVFFVSHAKERMISGQRFGDGCAKFMEITDFYHKMMSGSGFRLYSTDQRYLSVLGGTFVLVGFTKDALHVGSVTFMDSRFSHLLCE